MRRLQECPNGSASTACNYACLLCNLYRNAGLKRCQTYPVKSPLKLFYTLCNMLPTGLHYSPVVGIPLCLPSNSSILPFTSLLFFNHLRAWELGAIISIGLLWSFNTNKHCNVSLNNTIVSLFTGYAGFFQIKNKFVTKVFLYCPWSNLLVIYLFPGKKSIFFFTTPSYELYFFLSCTAIMKIPSTSMNMKVITITE